MCDNNVNEVECICASPCDNEGKRLIKILNGTDGNPGIKVTFSANGIDYISEHIKSHFQSGFAGLSIPNFERELPKGRHWTVCKHTDYKCEVRVWGSSVSGLQQPSFNFFMNSPNEIGFATNGGSFNLRGSWRKEDWSRRKKLNTNTWPWKWENHEFVYARWPIAHDGSYTASVSGIKIRYSARLKRNSAGFAEVEYSGCDTQIGNMNFNFNAGRPSLAGLIANQMKSDLEGNIKQHFSANFCPVLNKIVQPLVANVNSYLSQAENLDNENLQGFKMDYSLLNDPEIINNVVTSKLNGGMQHESNKEKIPFYPTDMAPLTINQTRMIYIQTSDYVLNSFFYEAHKANLTKLSSAEVAIHGFKPFVKQMTEGEMCLCMDLPENDPMCLPLCFQTKENATATVTVKALTTPVIIFKKDSANFDVSGRLQVFVHDGSVGSQTEENTPEIQADISVRTNLINLRMESPENIHQPSILRADVEIKDLTVDSVQYSKSFNDEEFQIMVEFYREISKFYVNQQVKLGIPLMMNIGQFLENPEFRFLERTLEIGGDVVI